MPIERNRPWTAWQLVAFVASTLMFGLLMGLRTEAPTALGRIAIAALAGAVLSVPMGMMRLR